MKVILHLNDDGTPAITAPEKSYVEKYGIEWIANKAVPGSGTPYWIVDAKDLPDLPQEAWVLDPNTPPTGVTP
jgi:hypothetical protein